MKLEVNAARHVLDWLKRQPGAVSSLSRTAVVFVTDILEGTVRLWDEGICELLVHDALHDKILYWNHLGQEDLPALFRGVADFFHVLNGFPVPVPVVDVIHPIRLLFVCSTGMTSGLLSELVRSMAEENGWPVKTGFAGVDTYSFSGFDLVLFAPQCASVYNKLDREEKSHALVLDSLDYGTANVCGILDKALKK